MLYEKLATGAEFLGGKDYYQQNSPNCISNNLNPNFQIRYYQLEAFGRFKYYMEEYIDCPKNSPIQVLYHMATGSGKTLIMAGLMLYLYEKGYRKFLFFVNNANIIDKTRDNFLNSTASKYLFNDTIQINNQQIRIKEVSNFQAANPDDMNIVFSTIQGLHQHLNTPRENILTYDDFENEKIVLISDETHHINAETKNAKNLNQKRILDLTTWESTINKIFNANAQNILLEFTATIDLANKQILEKYKDKIIFDYPLKAFRLDGYSKEVKVLQSDIAPMDRALQAILLSQFRRKIFEKHSWLIKPVILFKSKTIKDSNAFFDEFTIKMKTLKADDLAKIKSNPNLDAVLQCVFSYFDQNQINSNNLALELREDFSEDKCISVNSKDESEKKQIIINTLEDSDNEYRAVFAVDKLNEGWDVLNLFDIVRLYNTRDAKTGKPGKTTLSEAQLIGRGARYCPFRLNDEQPLYQRKYDIRNDEKEHELKLCEELYYHSAYNPRYIQELHTALKEIGVKAKRSRQLKLTLKPEFKETIFYKEGVIFKNKRVKYTREDVEGLNTSFIETTHKISLLTGHSQSSMIFESELQCRQLDKKQKDYFIRDFGLPVIKKALCQFPEYRFANLKRLFPHLKSASEFLTSDAYLGKIKVEVEGTEDKVNQLNQDDKLTIVMQVLKKLSNQLQMENIEYKGKKEFEPYMVRDTFANKILNVVNDGNSDQEYGIAQNETTNESLNMNLSDKGWFVFNENYGTSEEKSFVKYINKVMDKLKKQYAEVYLIRNERHFKLFDFGDGQAFEPDFVLFLIEIERDKRQAPRCHQVFIEPKGSYLIKQDGWKNNFLIQLEAEHKIEPKIEKLLKNINYIIQGMPFYNDETKTKYNFEKEFKTLIE